MSSHMADLQYFQDKLAESIGLPAWIVRGVSETEWTLRRLAEILG